VKALAMRLRHRVAAVAAAGLLAVCGLQAAAAQPSPVQPPRAAIEPLPDALHQAVAQAHREEQLVGTVVATWADGRLQASAFGHAHGPRQQTLAADSRLQVGSIAKTLTTLALLRLVSQQRVALDAEVGPLLPGVPIDNPWAATAPLRLRHLLDMSGGLADVRLWQMFDTRHRAGQPLAEAWRRDATVLRLRTPPGAQFSYSNLSHTLAAAVLETMTGERYENWAARELLAPLGLHDSTLHFTPQAAPGADARLAWGHVDDGSAVAAIATAVRPAGQFTTTAPDLMRLAAFLIAGDGRVGGHPFIRPELLAAMAVPAGTEAAAAGLATGYGLGLFTRDRHGALLRCHGGSVAGFRALWCFDRARARAYAVLHNSDREAARHERFEALLVQHLQLAQAPQPAVAAAADVAQWNGRYVPHPSRLEVLRLPDQLFGSWRLQVQPDGGTWAPWPGPVRPLVSQGARQFRQDDRVQGTLVLLTGPAGERRVSGQGLTLQRLSPSAWWAQWAAVAGGAAGLLLLAVLPLLRRPAQAWRQPACVAVWALVAAGVAVALQPWQRLGEPTLASLALAATSAALPLALLAQAALALRGARTQPAAWWMAGAAVLGLGGCALLMAYGLLPLRLWRV
jgi:CubicO group peptidase (beta-lactamase class C family)